jgi:hypothetical protein
MKECVGEASYLKSWERSLGAWVVDGIEINYSITRL